MLPDRVSNPGPLTYESGALPIALCGPAEIRSIWPYEIWLVKSPRIINIKENKRKKNNNNKIQLEWFFFRTVTYTNVFPLFSLDFHIYGENNCKRHPSPRHLTAIPRDSAATNIR